MKLLTLVLFIELHVAEVEKHIDGDLDEVQAIEDPAQNEDRAALADDKELDALHHNAGDVAEPDEDLKLLTLYAVSGFNEYEIAKVFRLSQPAIHKRIAKITLFLKKF